MEYQNSILKLKSPSQMIAYVENSTRPKTWTCDTRVAGAEEIEDNTHGIAAAKAFNESRPCRLRRLMSLVLPLVNHVFMD